jgi:hypothetical protein
VYRELCFSPESPGSENPPWQRRPGVCSLLRAASPPSLTPTCWPSSDRPPVGGRFYDELKCANLAALRGNFKAAGARFVAVAAVIDNLPLRELYAQSLAGCEVQLVCLIADDDTVRSRLRQRDTGPKLEQHLRALHEHRRTPTTTAIEDFTVTNDRAAADVATEILVAPRVCRRGSPG